MDRPLHVSEQEPEPAPKPPEPPQEGPAESISAEAGESPRPGRSGQRRRSRGGRGRRRSGALPKPVAPAPPETQEPAAPEVAGELPAAVAPLERRPPQPAQRAPRPPKGAVVLAIGLPGSGKSSWFKRRGVTPLSSDLLRTLLFDDTTEQRYQDLVFSTLRSLLRARLVARMPWNYVDATNLSPRERHGWIKMAREFGYEVHAVFFDVPAEVCMERNRRRARIVPEEVMQRMAAKLRPPSFDEGFAKIIVVRVKKRKDDAAEAPEEEGQSEQE
ncbi:MAG: ATP-binding protein [Acidobacteriia bacterium]|nr:ATP-binding protein [Terriglobia bacterium]